MRNFNKFLLTKGNRDALCLARPFSWFLCLVWCTKSVKLMAPKMILICAFCKKQEGPEWLMTHSGAEIFFLSLKNFLLCVLQRYFCWLALFSENIPPVPQVVWEREKAALWSMRRRAVEPHSKTSCNQNSSTLHVCRLTFALAACWTQFPWGLNCKQKLRCLFCFHAIPILLTPFSLVQRQLLTKKHDLTISGPFSPH